MNLTCVDCWSDDYHNGPKVKFHAVVIFSGDGLCEKHLLMHMSLKKKESK